jgi:hypothetical protein
VKAKGTDGAVSWSSTFNKGRRGKIRKMKRTRKRMVRMKHVNTAAPLPSVPTTFLQNFAVNKTQAIIKSCTC